MYTIFGDWLDVIIASLAGDDDSYRSLMREYQNQHENETVQSVFDLYTEAFGELVLVTRSTRWDSLGELYERFRLTSDQFSQHFTPEAVCQVLARICTPNEAEIRNATADNPLQIADPACGSGRFLISTAHHLRTVAPDAPVLFVGQDINSSCARMAVINFTLHDIPGYIIQGDSLAENIIRCWRIQPLPCSENIWPIQRISTDEDSIKEH
jgi:type I restriction-modification system DNA methylase subunit